MSSSRCLHGTQSPRSAASTSGLLHGPRSPPHRYVLLIQRRTGHRLWPQGSRRRPLDEFHQIFPDCRLSDETRAADNWATESGGRYYGVSIGGTTSGRAANLLNIDDPIKARERREWPPTRTNTFLASAALNRLKPARRHATRSASSWPRWHPDDLAGRVQT